MKVLFTGDRNPQKEYLPALKEVFHQLKKREDIWVLVGDCPTGVDAMVDHLCLQFHIPYKTFYANWKELGRSAGMRRNLDMLNEPPDLVVACHNDLGASKGTKHCSQEAIKRGIPTILIPRESDVDIDATMALHHGAQTKHKAFRALR